MTDKKDDLTSLFDISDFEHEDDPVVDEYFSQKQSDEDSLEQTRVSFSPEDLESEEKLKEEDRFSGSELESDSEGASFDETQPDFEESSFDETQPDFEESSLEETQPDFEESSFDETQPDLEESSLDETQPDLEESSFDNTESDFEESSFDETQPGFEETSFDNTESDFEDSSLDETGPDFEDSSFEETPPELSGNESGDKPAHKVEEASIEEKKKSQKIIVSGYEDFEDVSLFAENSHYGKFTAKGNPPFSLLITDIQYEEDAQYIMSLLKEYGFANDSTKSVMEKSLERGSLIISRISEFALIFLYRKLIPLELKVQVGPSDFIFKADSYDGASRGRVSEKNISQNKDDSIIIKNERMHTVLLSSLSTIPGYIVVDFLGHCFASESFQRYPHIGEEQGPLSEEILLKEGRIQQIQESLMEKLKGYIVEKGGNGGIDLEVSIIPLFDENLEDYKYLIKVECHAVWIEKKTD